MTALLHWSTMVSLTLLAVAGGLCLLRLIRRQGSLADRVVALDALLVVTVSAVAVQSLRNGSGAFLDLVLVTALVGFTGTVTVARYVERRGA